MAIQDSQQNDLKLENVDDWRNMEDSTMIAVQFSGCHVLWTWLASDLQWNTIVDVNLLKVAMDVD